MTPSPDRSSPEATKAQAWQQHYSTAPVVASYRADERLQAPEVAIFELLKDELSQARLLDLGVGGGRTSLHLAGRCKSYTALDFANAMVAACRQRFINEPWFTPASFVQADARQLPFPDAAFDLVLFSFNGIDYVSSRERLAVLAQCRRVLRPGGRFVYSAHNLNWVDGQGWLPRRGSWREWFGDRQYRHQMLRLNATLPTGAAEMELKEPPDSLSVYYARPAEHLRQLYASGFEHPRVFDCAGQDVTGSPSLASLRDPWLYFMSQVPPA